MPKAPQSPTRAHLARELVRYKMEEYSEDFFCAGWLVDLEFQLWNAAEVQNPSAQPATRLLPETPCPHEP